MFICTLLTKRFLYFRPSSTFLEISETYKVIKQGHLYGWLAEGKQYSKIILLCHDNVDNISYHSLLIKQLHSLGFSVLAFDYSGFGKSTGVPNEQTLYQDASYMVALIRQTYNNEDIIIYGHGIGCAIATYVAIRYNIPTIILVSPVRSIRCIIKHTILKYISMIFSEFNLKEYLKAFKGRSLLIHSRNDLYVPYDSIKDLIELSTKHIETVGTHKNPVIPFNSIKDFII